TIIDLQIAHNPTQLPQPLRHRFGPGLHIWVVCSWAANQKPDAAHTVGLLRAPQATKRLPSRQ
ncbi:MAG: hypothetical protein WCC81_10070, partial [Pseudolabrys sp.]